MRDLQPKTRAAFEQSAVMWRTSLSRYWPVVMGAGPLMAADISSAIPPTVWISAVPMFRGGASGWQVGDGGRDHSIGDVVGVDEVAPLPAVLIYQGWLTMCEAGTEQRGAASVGGVDRKTGA